MAAESARRRAGSPPSRAEIHSRTSSKYPKAPTDFTAIAIAYAEAAIKDRKREWACRWIRAAAYRFLRDLERTLGPRPSFTWSGSHANNACRFIELLPHIEGVWDTPTITLEPSQIFFVVQLFGFRNLDGGRRYTEALYAVARKNAKSTLAAAVMLVCMCLENEPGAQLISAAMTGKQARIVWNVAKKMVEKTPDLREEYEVEVRANSILRAETTGVMVPINSKASSQDGLNPSITNLDEVHAHKTADLINVLRSAAGARRNPLWLYTTTEGYENPGPWSEIRSFAQNVLLKVLRADHFLVIFYALDEEDDELDHRTWIKANPLMMVNPLLHAEIQKLAISAQAMPSVAAEFRIKRCNRQSSTSKGWVNLSRFMRCGGAIPLAADGMPDLAGHPCWGAFDLSSTTDMTAWSLLWKVNGIYYSWTRYWVPEGAIAHRKERGTVDYEGWVRAGHIIRTDGDAINQELIKQQILEDCARYAPLKVTYDPWNAASLGPALMEEGVPIEVFVQGPKSYHPAMKEFEIAYINGTLRHGGNPVLRWNAANLVDRRDVNLNMAPDRSRSADKIDGIVSLIMCFGLSIPDPEEGDADGFFAAPIRSRT